MLHGDELSARIEAVISGEVNPALAAHGGFVTFVGHDGEGTAFLTMGGGCHGCSMSRLTMLDGVQTMLVEQVDGVLKVQDITDHETGENLTTRKRIGARIEAVTRTIYLDGNSLGPPMPGVVERLRRFVEEEWATDLIGGWNEHRWWELPLEVGEQIARWSEPPRVRSSWPTPPRSCCTSCSWRRCGPARAVPGS